MFCETFKKVWVTSAQLKEFKEEDFLNLANWKFFLELYFSSQEIQILVEFQKKTQQKGKRFR